MKVWTVTPKILLLSSLLVPVLSVHAAQAQSEDWATICKKPGTQLEMNTCAHRDFKAADQELNQIYRQLRASYKGTAQEPQLVNAQLAWLKFRDADCKFSADRFKGGSIAPLIYSTCQTNLTRQRIANLQDYLDVRNP